MSVETHIYDKQFFKNTKDLEESSAKSFVDIVYKHFNFNSVVDLGCGIGIYLKEFEKRGVKILGYDGAPAAIDASLVGNKILLHDLSSPLSVPEKFDLGLCIEVAEHLPPEASGIIIDSLVALSDTIIFTAATPGQGSREIGHINEQPHEYWIEIFKSKGFTFNDKLSNLLRSEMKDNDVIWWIVNNLMIFNKLKP